MNKMKKVEESLKNKEEELDNREKDIEAKWKMVQEKEKELLNKEKSLLEKEQNLIIFEKELKKSNKKPEYSLQELKCSQMDELYANKFTTESSVTRPSLALEYSMKNSELNFLNERLENPNKINNFSINHTKNNTFNSKNIEYTDITNLNVEGYLSSQQIINKIDTSTNPSTKNSNLTPTAYQDIQYLKSFNGSSVNSNELLMPKDFELFQTNNEIDLKSKPFNYNKGSLTNNKQHDLKLSVKNNFNESNEPTIVKNNSEMNTHYTNNINMKIPNDTEEKSQINQPLSSRKQTGTSRPISQIQNYYKGNKQQVEINVNNEKLNEIPHCHTTSNNKNYNNIANSVKTNLKSKSILTQEREGIKKSTSNNGTNNINSLNRKYASMK